MNVRSALASLTLLLLTACGHSGQTPWDLNHDGLVTACEGLNPMACDATPGCERGALACTMECRDDGHGGCLPCPGGDVCRPVAPNPPLPPAVPDCSRVPTGLCPFLPACELTVVQACPAYDVASDDPAPTAPPPCGNGCHDVEVCVNRQLPQRCEDLDPSSCFSKPGCALEGGESTCADDCASPQGCGSCTEPALRCVTMTTPGPCDGRDENTCTLDGRCQLEASVCAFACDATSPCPPCAEPALRCVPVPPTDDCAARDPNVCALDGRCVIAAGGACPAVCELEADGGCKPCPVFSVCVPAAAPPPSRCAGLDLVTCEASGCEVFELGVACTLECRDDGDGGCLPCIDFVCSEPDPTAVDGGVAPPRP